MPDEGRIKPSIIELSKEKYRDENGKPIVYNRFKRPEKEFQMEQIDDHDVCESGGYIKTKDRVEQLLLAGKNLQLWRKARYDFETAEQIEQEFFLDPTRAQNYDLADATQHMLRMEIKARRAKEEREAENDSIPDSNPNTGGGDSNPGGDPPADPTETPS